MKSGTGDVWGSDDDEDEAETEAAVDETPGDESVVDSGSEAPGSVGGASEDERGEDAASSAGSVTSDAGSGRGVETSSEVASENDIAEGSLSTSDSDGGNADDDTQPYVVRRMLKDKSVQFERDERLTFFVHDDVKTGEQELEAETQDRFGRDIPVFDIREAVYRAALRNREDVFDELKEMGYTRD